MTYWTWDILSTVDPLDSGSEMENWEDRIAKESDVKLKFPVLVKESEIDDLEIEIVEPEVKSPISKKDEIRVQTVDISKKKKDKNTLF
jgi:hypothetical protein